MKAAVYWDVRHLVVSLQCTELRKTYAFVFRVVQKIWNDDLFVTLHPLVSGRTPLNGF